jgi:predicted metalloendopeptidase
MPDYGLFAELGLENKRKVNQIITQKNPPKSAFGTANQTQLQEQKWFQSYQTLYASCMNETQLNNLGHRPIEQAAEVIRFPLTGTRVGRGQLSHFLADLHYNLPFQSFISVLLAEENTNKTYPRVEVGQLAWTLISRENYRNPAVLDIYQDAVEQSFELIHGKQYIPFVDWFMSYAPRKVNRHTYGNWSHLAQEIVALEVQLVEISVDSDVASDPTMSNNIISVQELDQRYPFMNWTYFFKFLKAKFGLIEPIRQVNLRTRTYFEKLNALLPKLSPELLNYYLWWHLIQQFAPYLNDASREIMQQYYTTLDGLPADAIPARKTICARSIQGDLMARWFVTEHFPKSAVQDIETLTRNILKGFEKRVNESTWFDPTSQTEANLKLQRMKLQMGYPKYFDDITTFENDLGQLEFNPLGYLENQRKIKRNDVQAAWSNLNPQPRAESPWVISVLEVNAFYNSMNNEIVRNFFLLKTM